MQTICHEKKDQKPKQSSPVLPIHSMPLVSKFEELLTGTSPDRAKLLLESICDNVSRIKDPETLISDKVFPAFKLCYKQQKKLPDTCWDYCEKKIMGFINDPKFSGFFDSVRKRQLILFTFPSPTIVTALHN